MPEKIKIISTLVYYLGKTDQLNSVLVADEMFTEGIPVFGVQEVTF